jgi:hypothetical protein
MQLSLSGACKIFFLMPVMKHQLDGYRQSKRAILSHVIAHLSSNIPPNALFMQMLMNKTIQEFKE